MSFYLKPVTGFMSLHELEKIAVKRLAFLSKVHGAGGQELRLLDIVKNEGCVQNSDCLIAGSQEDNISHFILRLLLGVDLEAQSFFFEAETILFAFRFTCMTSTEIYHLLKSVQRNCKEAKKVEEGLFNEQNTKHLLAAFLSIQGNCKSWKSVIRKYMQGCHGDYFTLPFQAVLSLVSKREVILKNGLAYVPFSKLKEVLVELFKKLLTASVCEKEELIQTQIRSDERIQRLACKVKAVFRRFYQDSDYRSIPAALSVGCDNIHRLVHRFPPCMKSLHQVLKQKHRLHHHDRIQYTLFLKEIGMPLQQALIFWSEEYSQASSAPNGCHHNWKKEEKRYVYNIRHLYGLEGLRRNYVSHCCSALQKRVLSAREDGGCPFVHFDNCHLERFLSANKVKETRQKQIFSLRSEGNATECCKLFLHCQVNSGCHSEPDSSDCATSNELVTELGIRESKRDLVTKSATGDNSVDLVTKSNTSDMVTKTVTSGDTCELVTRKVKNNNSDLVSVPLSGDGNTKTVSRNDAGYFANKPVTVSNNIDIKSVTDKCLVSKTFRSNKNTSHLVTNDHNMVTNPARTDNISDFVPRLVTNRSLSPENETDFYFSERRNRKRKKASSISFSKSRRCTSACKHNSVSGCECLENSEDSAESSFTNFTSKACELGCGVHYTACRNPSVNRVPDISGCGGQNKMFNSCVNDDCMLHGIEHNPSEIHCLQDKVFCSIQDDSVVHGIQNDDSVVHGVQNDGSVVHGVQNDDSVVRGVQNDDYVVHGVQSDDSVVHGISDHTKRCFKNCQSSSQIAKTSEKGLEENDSVVFTDKPDIHKPVDYYLSFCKLMEGLTTSGVK